MTARTIDPAELAESIRAEIRADLAAIPDRLTVVGFLVDGDRPARTYAEYTRRACAEVGIDFDLRTPRADDIEAAVRDASADDGVHGVFVYYPVRDPERDRWLRELVDPRKDVEGLHSFWSRCLYENRRFIDDEGTRRAVLPCTPLAVMKLLGEAGAFRGPAGTPLASVKACVFNRSEIVGRPLAAMLANDGAEVTSFDLGGSLVFRHAAGIQGHHVDAVAVDRAAALAEADVVVTGVPSRDFPLVRADEIKPGAVCLNFSTMKNFADDIVDRASVFVPRVGSMTVTMAMRNAVRLYRNARLAV